MYLKKTKALIIKTTDFSETSQILTLFTPFLGKIKVIAKGAKRQKNQFNGPFDILSLLYINFIDKFPHSLPLLTNADVINDFYPIRKNLYQFTSAMLLLEILNKIAPERQFNPTLFHISISLLQKISSPDFKYITLFYNLVEILKITGFLPKFTTCALCNHEIPNLKNIPFSAHHGGPICPNHFNIPQDLIMSYGTLKFLDAISNKRIKNTSVVKLHPIVENQLKNFIIYIFEYILNKKLSSLVILNSESLK